MKIIGIVQKDWANAGWNIFQALKRHGLDAHLIYLQERRDLPTQGYKVNYDLKFWKDKERCLELISEADIYHLFESSMNFQNLKKLKLKDRPRIMSINSSSYYGRGAQNKFNTKLKPHADKFCALTLNYPIKNLSIGLQPVDERIFTVRADYSLKNSKKGLIAGCAPGYKRAYINKGCKFLKSKLKNKLDVVMNVSQKETYNVMYNKHDIFTHGIYAAYGYTLIEAAMMGIPCFGHIHNRDKHLVQINDTYPVLDIGPKGEKLNQVFELMSSKTERERLGKLMRQWALKYHSYAACFETYKKLYEKLLN